MDMSIVKPKCAVGEDMIEDDSKDICVGSKLRELVTVVVEEVADSVDAF